ncbi:MAG TPA: MmcQ/YjbR family DNA-binding protein [Acidimicrobiales bacterium]|nr:MmcQ/YjbR family DNA-binding protein [Acidimicrobiales bacterium]
MRAARSATAQWDAARSFALSLPAAFEDFPWGMATIKVATGSKWPPVFLWLGDRDADRPAVYVKLTASYDEAVSVAGAQPTTISGVGKYGRLTISLPVGDFDRLLDWVEESYRDLAPKRLVAELDRSRSG